MIGRISKAEREAALTKTTDTLASTLASISGLPVRGKMDGKSVSSCSARKTESSKQSTPTAKPVHSLKALQLAERENP